MAFSSSVMTIFFYNSLLLALSFSYIGSSQGQLQVGFYSSTCPNAESIISSVVREAVLSDPTIAAALLRLQFHDCFVQGCDGSVLINKPNAERGAFGHQGLRGFEVIERAKAQLESECRGVVSCADIIALSARDSIVLSNGPDYQVETGRRDGRRSNVSDADNMPDVSDSVQLLKDKFREKGLTDKDLVVLSGAHTIGTTACFFMNNRLYNFVPGGGSDPTISPQFLPELKSTCPQNGNVNIRLGLDRGSDQTFDTQILRNIRDGFAVLESDAKLYDDDSTKHVINSYFGFLSSIFGPFFESDFISSIVKMGQIGVKTGSQGEIRRVCSAFN
ncbi:peroxidase 43-like [Tasmannia lanceolata]|uniref:peroxidase 43-like n=1 Tax=Tasmannia lanceolata TaxID=3420 RepID=UPI00406345FD